MNEKKEFNEQISKDMVLANAMAGESGTSDAESCETEISSQDANTTFIQTETETGENDKPLIM